MTSSQIRRIASPPERAPALGARRSMVPYRHIAHSSVTGSPARRCRQECEMKSKTAWRPIGLVLVLFAASCLGAPPAGAQAGAQVFRYPFREPDHPIDPTKGGTLFNGHYTGNLFEGLAEPAPGGKLTMVGATKYETSDQGRVYVFTLRRG